MEESQMLWIIIALGTLFGLVSALKKYFLRKNSYEELNNQQKILEEEQRSKSNYWWGSGE
jgi:hypothetical protein